MVYLNDLTILWKVSEKYENSRKGWIKTMCLSAIDKDRVSLFFSFYMVSSIPYEVCKDWGLHGSAGNLFALCEC